MIPVNIEKEEYGSASLSFHRFRRKIIFDKEHSASPLYSVLFIYDNALQLHVRRVALKYFGAQRVYVSNHEP